MCQGNTGGRSQTRRVTKPSRLLPGSLGREDSWLPLPPGEGRGEGLGQTKTRPVPGRQELAGFLVEVEAVAHVPG